MKITLSNGVTYTIVRQGQLAHVLRAERQRILDEAYDQGVKLTEAEVKAKVDAFTEVCGYATLEMVLNKLPPDKRRDWMTQYRFGGVTRKLGTGFAG